MNPACGPQWSGCPVNATPFRHAWDRGINSPYTSSASLAHAVLAQARAVRSESGTNLAGLTGGVFQNRVLAELTADLLRAEGFEVVLPASLPVNDAAISYGQIVETAHADPRQAPMAARRTRPAR